MNSLAHLIFSKSNHEVVFGVAGSRKTSLAVDIAHLHKDKKILYLSFGRENTKSAKERLPSNTLCINFHSFAKKQLNLNSSQIVERVGMEMLSKAFLTLSLKRPQNHILESVALLLEHFSTSGQPLLSLRKLTLHSDFQNLKRMDKEQVCFLVTQYWMNAFSNGFPVTHDMYLKEVSMRPASHPYDILIVDECQDLNDAMYALIDNIIASNFSLKSLKLGDPTQQIFSFLGASERFLYEKPTYRLNSTFRFGGDLVNVVNKFMKGHPLPYFSEMSSLSKRDTLVSTYSSDDAIWSIIDENPKVALVSQFNLTLWQWMIKLTEKQIPFFLLGQLQIKEKQVMKSLHNLYHTGTCQNAQWRSMGYDRVKFSARERGDRALLLACRFVETLPYDKHGLFDQVSLYSKETQRGAEVLLTTIHQAKGLEFSFVVLADDLPEEHSGCKMTRADIHRVYTSLTRAKENILLPASYFSNVVH